MTTAHPTISPLSPSVLPTIHSCSVDLSEGGTSASLFLVSPLGASSTLQFYPSFMTPPSSHPLARPPQAIPVCLLLWPPLALTIQACINLLAHCLKLTVLADLDPAGPETLNSVHILYGHKCSLGRTPYPMRPKHSSRDPLDKTSDRKSAYIASSHIGAGRDMRLQLSHFTDEETEARPEG